MTAANDSVTVTPGAGATIATHTVGGKEHQAVAVVDPAGHIAGSRSLALVQSAFAIQAQNKHYLAIWNPLSSGKVLRIHAIGFKKTMAAITGVAWQADIKRITSAPTGGTVLTPVACDTGNAPAFGTAVFQHAPTGGAAIGSTLYQTWLHSEETNVAAQLQEALACVWPPQAMPMASGGAWMTDIVVRENEGYSVQQITNTIVGTYSAWALISVD